MAGKAVGKQRCSFVNQLMDLRARTNSWEVIGKTHMLTQIGSSAYTIQAHQPASLSQSENRPFIHQGAVRPLLVADLELV